MDIREQKRNEDFAGERGKSGNEWHLTLYVAGQSPRSVAAIGNLRRICENHIPGPFQVEVVDLLADPQQSREHQIVAIPTLVRTWPEPVRKIIGDLSDLDKTLQGLQLSPPVNDPDAGRSTPGAS